MKLIIAYLNTLFVGFIFANEVVICNHKFLKKNKIVYLKDLNLNVKMITINESKTGKFIFGYFDKTYRNDTLLIYSIFRTNPKGFIIYDYYNHHIKTDIDSTKRTFTCSNGKITFNTYEEYQKGIVTTKTIFNTRLN